MRIQALMAGAAMAIVASAAAVSANAAELVTNGSFETGNLSGWTLTGNTGFSAFSSVVDSTLNGGQHAYQNGALGTDGIINQTVATVAGQAYEYSFWLMNFAPGDNDFTASLGGVVLQSFVDSAAFSFTHFTGSVVAATNNATLSFAFRNEPSYWQIDDISLAGVPEPASWALMITGFMGVGAAIRANRRRQAALAA
ncbi:MAG: PEPxxWA-CTERM sorting domain-containing protein [Bradyrhizobium sp.]